MDLPTAYTVTHFRPNYRILDEYGSTSCSILQRAFASKTMDGCLHQSSYSRDHVTSKDLCANDDAIAHMVHAARPQGVDAMHGLKIIGTDRRNLAAVE